MLEIGISTGASIFMWRDYFQKSKIYGIDIEVTPAVENQERIIVSQADQGNYYDIIATLNKWNNPIFDLIIDDGSHVVSHQRNTIQTLWPSLKKGGIFIIEDLHTNIFQNFSTHPHLNIALTSHYLDSSPTVHELICETMKGNAVFLFHNEIEDIYYFNNVHTKSLSCVFVKKV